MTGMQVIPQKYRQADVAELTPHPQGARQGDVGAIHQSIEVNGWYGACVVQKSSGYIIAGKHRFQAAQAHDAKRIPILELDCDDETALKILLADNRTSDLATYDDAALVEVLQAQAELDALLGTGYDGDDVDALVRDLNTPFVPPPEPVPPASAPSERTCPECGYTWTPS